MVIVKINNVFGDTKMTYYEEMINLIADDAHLFTDEEVFDDVDLYLLDVRAA